MQKEGENRAASGERKVIKLRGVGGNLLCRLTPILQTPKLIAMIHKSLNYWKALFTLGLKIFIENILPEY